MMDTVAAARAVGGRAVGTPAVFTRVTTDSRAIAPGDLFVALTGPRFDGHDFVAAARDAGAAAALVADERAAALPGSLIAVGDPLRALGALARHWRGRFDLPVVAVVGSNGKTTTKEMIAAIFRAGAGPAKVLATEGNFNNAIGLPLSVLGLREAHCLAVFELGMNHRFETRELAAIAAPTIAVVVNAQREHQDFMASVAEVAAEHADAIAALPEGGTAVISADDAYAEVWRDAARRVRAKTCEFGLVRHAEVHARFTPRRDGSDVELRTPAGDAAVSLAVPGRHMVHNALAATAVALAAQVALPSIVRGLEDFRALDGRLVACEGLFGVRVIDDTYNANPDSVRAAIDVLALAAPTRWLVLGDMGEVGAQGPAFHREVGEYARTAGVERLAAVGRDAIEAAAAFGAGSEGFADVEALAAAVAAAARAGDTVLVKGSRFMRMERVVAVLTGAPAAGAH
jgi:UDP-N-acetylmuramoyl-tripeptide--D-alanyl-D-alanine ligase